MPIQADPTDDARDPRILDVRRLRADTLAGFLRLAEQALGPESRWRTLSLSCSQYFADEASDAVHDGVIASESWFPAPEDAVEDDRVAYETRWRHLRWDDNDGAVYGFAPLCNEEGWSEAAREPAERDGDFYDEGGGTPSPLMIVHRVDGALRPIWLGVLHRPWLDFPGAMRDREEARWSGEDLEFAPEPAMPPLQGRERELHAQVLADPADLGAREVLGDAWIERGDPRGEFWTLSTRPDLTGEMRARAAGLVLEHGRGWLGPLQAVMPLAGSLFGNGPFLRKAVVYGDAKAFARVGDAAEWATVEELTFANTSHRVVTRAMKNLRAVGPLRVGELAPLLGGAWRVEDLDVDLGREPVKALVKLRLPLVRLRLRAPEGVDLTPLAGAPWWPALRRVELWLPGTIEDAPAAMARAFAETAPRLPAGCTLGVGQLSGGYRTGWMIAGTATHRALEVHHPDARLDQGPRLAAALGVTLPASWSPPEDDWLTFGLGVSPVAGVRGAPP